MLCATIPSILAHFNHSLQEPAEMAWNLRLLHPVWSQCDLVQDRGIAYISADCNLCRKGISFDFHITLWL